MDTPSGKNGSQRYWFRVRAGAVHLVDER
jgi:tRNA (cmo5U34)-methyltransferase